MRRGKVVCDKCSAEFDMSKVEVKKEKLINDRIGMFFECPACGTKFPFAGVTKKGIKMQKRLKSLVTKINKLDGEDEKRTAYMKKREDLLKEYSKEVTGPYNEEEVLK